MRVAVRGVEQKQKEMRDGGVFSFIPLGGTVLRWGKGEDAGCGDKDEHGLARTGTDLGRAGDRAEADRCPLNCM
jgi:hypothetical protein